MKKQTIKTHDCNNCSRKCKGDVIRTPRGDIKAFVNCKGWEVPKGKFSLAELALAHPQGLHDTFSQPGLHHIDLNLIVLKVA